MPSASQLPHDKFHVGEMVLDPEAPLSETQAGTLEFLKLTAGPGLMTMLESDSCNCHTRGGKGPPV